MTDVRARCILCHLHRLSYHRICTFTDELQFIVGYINALYLFVPLAVRYAAAGPRPVNRLTSFVDEACERGDHSHQAKRIARHLGLPCPMIQAGCNWNLSSATHGPRFETSTFSEVGCVFKLYCSLLVVALLGDEQARTARLRALSTVHKFASSYASSYVHHRYR